MRKNKKKKIGNRCLQISRPWNVLINLMFIVYSVLCVYPMLLVIGVSFTDEGSLLKYGYKVIPEQFSLDSYTYLMKSASDILHAYGVTILTTVVGTLLSLAVIALYAYPISRRDFKYKKQFTFFIFFTMLFNGGMVPWYIVCTKVLHIQDTFFALVLPYVVNAWYTLILRTFFSTSVPDSIVESAKIDGAGEFKAFLKMVLPMSVPGLATIGLFNTLRYWNDWWLPMMLTTDPNLSNLQYFLQRILLNIQELTGYGNSDAAAELSKVPSEGARMAICVIAVGPIIFAYPFFQKYFVQGLTIGAVKG